MHRRSLLGALAASPLIQACRAEELPVHREAAPPRVDPVLASVPLGTPPWPTLDPFLFCVHHDDAYPAGTTTLGPAASLSGRTLGNDFGSKDGWSMYHGQVVPGFPQHPHRGFETVTVVRRGLVDHSDSMGAAARYGQGDVQWLTAGRGVVHAEMFPLLRPAEPNPLELFQIWLNLPAVDKMSEPHFTMLWSQGIPRRTLRDEQGRATQLTVVAGRYEDASPQQPPPKSWASRSSSDLAIWTLAMEPGARFTLPPARPGSNRMLYFFRGARLHVGGRLIAPRQAVTLRADSAAPLEAGPDAVELLLLQAQPIGEPVVKHGPFVMNTREEIQRAWSDYRATRFGGWPWPKDDPVHGTEGERFARHASGRVERGG